MLACFKYKNHLTINRVDLKFNKSNASKRFLANAVAKLPTTELSQDNPSTNNNNKKYFHGKLVFNFFI